MKKVFSLLLALVMCQLITATTFAASSTSDANSTDEQLISDYFSTVDQQMWNELEDVLSDSYYQSISSTIDNNAYADNNLGLYNIEAVNQVSVLGEIPASTYEYYSPIIAELEDDGVEEIIAYVVECELDTYEDTEFYFTGNNYLTFFCGTQDGNRYIADCRITSTPVMTSLSDSIGEIAAPDYGTNSASSCTYNRVPSSIKVLRWRYGDSSTIPETVNFKRYVKVVAACEAGYDSRDEDYHYSNILCIRNYAWYRILNADPSRNYHVTDTLQTNGGDFPSNQEYNPDVYWDPDTWVNLYDRVDDMWDENMVNSDLEIFDSWFTKNDPDYDYSGSGRFVQDTSNEMARDGWHYEEILDYFYSYSEMSDGPIEFVPTGEHLFYRTQVIGDDLYGYCHCGYRENIGSIAR